MIVTLEESKQHLRVDGNDDDVYIQMLIDAAEQFIVNATGKTFDGSNALAKTACLLLTADLYDNRQMSTDRASEKVRDIVTMILTQLSLSGDAS